MRIPLAPPGYRVDTVRDKSWDEHRRTKAVAVTFRTSTGDALFTIYRLEPEWVLAGADEMGAARCLELLRFYPWPPPGRPEDRLLQADAIPARAVTGALRLDGELVRSQRYVSGAIVVDLVFLAGASLGVARPVGAPLPDLQTGPYESLRPELPVADGGEYRGYLEQRSGGSFVGDIGDLGLKVEIRNDWGELAEPPDGVTYSSSYQVLDTEAPAFDATGSHSCVFCSSPDWQWILQMKPHESHAPVAWPPYLVSCDPCQQLRRADQIDALRERTARSEEWLLEYFDETLDRIELVKPRS